jgi:hypothetical protein
MSIQRASLPENFYDTQSDKLLCQPEPQYLFAALFLAAIGSSLPIPSGMGLSGRQAPNGGAPYIAFDRDQLKLADSLPSSLFALGVDFNKAPGNTIRINRPAYTNSTYTVASRKINSGQSISTTGIGISSEQTHLTLERYAGPYSSSAVRPYTIESFDANMGVNSIPSMVGTNLARDFHKFLDAVHVTIGGSGTAVYPEDMDAVDDATTVGSYPFTVEMLSRTEQLMDEAFLPTLPDGKRLMVLTPYQWKQLKHDPEYEANAHENPTFNLLYAPWGFVKTVCKFHIFVSSSLTVTNNSSSVPVHYGMACAPGGFMGGMGRPPRVASSTDDNYGETNKVIWLADLAFGITDSRFFYSLRTA